MHTSSQKHDCFASILSRWLLKRREHPREAAAALGVSHQTVYNWLGGDLPPRTRIALLARGLGVPERRLRRVIEADRAARSRRHA